MWGGTRKDADSCQPWRRVPAMQVGWTLEGILVGTFQAYLHLWNSAGQKGGQHCTSDGNSILCWAHLSSLGNPKKVKTRILLAVGTGTANSFSKDNNQLRLFYLSGRMTAVLLYTSWVWNARQAQASRPRCVFACLFGPSMEAKCTHTMATCHSVTWATATSRFGRRKQPPAEHAPPATWPPLAKEGVLLIFCMHVHISPWALGLFSCIQTAGTSEEPRGSSCPPHCRLPHSWCLCMTPN